jgi:lipopolysaccharide biosynthesis glycosyltransferase
VVENMSRDVPVHVHLILNRVRSGFRNQLVGSVEKCGLADVRVSVVPWTTRGVEHLLRSRLVTRTAYAVLFLGDLLPEDVRRCIYLDCDLVVERDILELWNTDLMGRTLGAVDNGMWQDSAEHQRRLGLLEPRYFNSGVLLIDLERWREREVGRRAMAVATRLVHRLILHDQDALNGALEGDWVALADHWNVWTIRDGLQPDEAVVYHYMGAPKPWDADYEGPFKDKFYDYLDRTAFAGWRPWNPGGLGRALRRVRRKVPYLPTAVRILGAKLGFRRV